MNIKQIIGLALIASPFVVLTVAMWRLDGIRTVAITWGIVTLTVAAIFAGVRLLSR